MMLFPDIWRIPFAKSPLLFFTGEFSAPLVAGQYQWSAVLQNFQPATTLTNQAVVFFWDFDFATDVSEEDYAGAISSTPLVSIYMSSKPNEPVFRQPFRCAKYYDNKIIYQGRRVYSTPSVLQFGITGIINQTAALLGKTSIKAIIQISAHEITEPDYKKTFEDGFHQADPVKQRPPTLTAAQQRFAQENAEHPQLRSEEGLNLPL